MLHRAVKAFAPARVPFPVMHVDTGHNLDEIIAFRDEIVAKVGSRLVVTSVQDDINAGRSVDPSGTRGSHPRIPTATLPRGIEENRFATVFGGAGTHEEQARATETHLHFSRGGYQWNSEQR